MGSNVYTLHRGGTWGENECSISFTLLVFIISDAEIILGKWVQDQLPSFGQHLRTSRDTLLMSPFAKDSLS